MLLAYIMYYGALAALFGTGFFLLGLLGGWLAIKVTRRERGENKRRDLVRAGWGGIGGGLSCFVIAAFVESIGFSMFVVPIFGGIVTIWLAHRNET